MCLNYRRYNILPSDGNVLCRGLGYGQALYTGYQNLNIESKEYRFLHQIDFNCDGSENALRQCNITERDDGDYCIPTTKVVAMCLEKLIEKCKIKFFILYACSSGVTWVLIMVGENSEPTDK